MVAAFQVLASTGDLTALGLRLPVKLYDPAVHYREDAGRPFGFGDTTEADRRATIEEGASARPAQAGPVDVKTLLGDGMSPSTSGERPVSKSRPK
jgi:hypothetical protein